MIRVKPEIETDQSDNPAALENRSMAITQSTRLPKFRSNRHPIVFSGESKEHFQASLSNSETSFDSDVSYNSSRPNSAPAGLDSIEFPARTSSLRSLSRIPSFKSKKPGAKKKVKKSSPRNSESSFSGRDEKRKNVSNSKLKSTAPALKSGKILRKTTSLRPVRILTKTVSSTSKRPLMRKLPEVPPLPDLSVNRATCSSALKNSKFPKYADVQPEGMKSEGLSAMKVCPFAYCSLHGHHHGPAPPLKRFLSVRRRLFRSQKSMRPNDRTSNKAKKSNNGKKVIPANKKASCQYVETLEAASASNAEGEPEMNFLGEGPHVGDDEANSDFRSLVEIFLGETSYPLIGFNENMCQVRSFHSARHRNPVTFQLRKETNQECCSIIGELDKQVSETTITSQKKEEMQMQMEKDKYISMWRLLHRSVLSGKVNGEDQEGDETRSLQEKNYYQVMGTENKDAGSQNIEFCHSDAIKLVKEAIDQILLPEVQDQSSDDQPISSNTNLDENLQENNRAKGGERSISTSMDSSKDSLRDGDKMKEENGTDKEEAVLETDSVITSEQEETVQKVGSKPNQPIPKNWSKLKKLILFKRFIKALDKLRTLNLREPRYLPLEPETEAERVNLRSQTMDERKSTEEWMLDYALRQVVAKLSPTRRRKVELLVEAFETIIPVSENGADPRHSSAVSPRSNLTQANVGTSIQGGTDMEQENEHKASNPRRSPTETPKRPQNCCIQTNMEKNNAHATNTGWKEDKLDAFELDGGEEMYSVTDNKRDVVDQSSTKVVSLDLNDFEQSEATKNLVSLSSACDPFNDQTAACKEIDRDSEQALGFPRPEDTKPQFDIDAAYKAWLEKQKYMKMWRIIYEHLVSGNVENFGGHLQINGSGKEELVNDSNGTDEAKRSSSEDFSGMVNDEGMKEHNAPQNTHLSQIDAIKLVEEAIDEIVLPENQDESSDDPSVTSDITSVQNVVEKNDSKGEEQIVSTCNNSADKNFKGIEHLKTDNCVGLEAGKTQLKDDTVAPEQEKAEPRIGSISNQQRRNSWSNLKKLILLKRFVKALEKVRKINPQKPRSLPLEPDQEAERINLRHQTTDERKSDEEWMLDHALQQAVARLTPARKRRVELLVEAFETVKPLSGTGTSPRHSAALSTQSMPIRAHKLSVGSVQKGAVMQRIPH